MGNEVPRSCRADKYLTQIDLQELFNDFNASILAARSPASIFSTLVRLAYTTPLQEAKEELADQSRHYAQQLIELRNAYPPTVVTPASTPPLENSCTSIEVPGKPSQLLQDGSEVQIRSEQLQRELQLWPANTFTIDVSTHNKWPKAGPYIRHDWIEWETEHTDTAQCIPRMSFKAFKFQEPETAKISVRLKGSRRDSVVVWNNKEHCLIDWRWKEYMEFWAYDKPRPGTEMIWVGYCARLEVSAFVKGGQLDGYEGICEFWVPV